MKKLLLLALLLVLINFVQAQNKAQRYAIKSGKLVLELSGSTIGTKTIYFDHYGDKYYEEEKSVTEVRMFGIIDKTETHKTMIMNQGKFWVIDHLEGKHINGDLPYYQSSHAYVEGMTKAEQEKMANEVLKSMGGERLGQEDVQGYSCDKIRVMGALSWIYKGIVLKSEANVMGIVSNEEAVEFEENARIASSKFDPPTDLNFVDVQAQQQAAFGQMDMSLNMDEEDYEEEDIIAVSYPFDKFQQVINSFDPAGYTKTMVMQQDGQHIALFMQGFGNVISVMASSDKNLVEEEEDFSQFESFRHDGKTLHYGDLTEEDMSGKALIVPYPEHDMYIIFLTVPGSSKETMLQWADELDF